MAYNTKIEQSKSKVYNHAIATKILDMMDKLRNGIGLRSYAQENPLKSYVAEGYDMFEEMMANIASDVVNFAMNLRIRVQNTGPKDHLNGIKRV